MSQILEYTPEQRLEFIRKWRDEEATRKEAELAWESMEHTVRNRSTKHFQNSPDWGSRDRNTLRTLFLATYIKENPSWSVLKCIAKWRKLFPAIELLMELYGTEALAGENRPLTKLANQKKMYFKRQLADLQRQFNVWDPEELYECWRNNTTPEQRKAKSITSHRENTIKEYAAEIIDRRAEQLTRNFSSLSEADQRALGW